MTASVLALPSEARVVVGGRRTLSALPLFEAISRKDFYSILESSELFWLAFCTKDSQKNRKFSTSVEGSLITIRESDEHHVSEAKKAIERIRLLSLKALEERRSCLISAIKTGGLEYYLQESKEVIDLNNNPDIIRSNEIFRPIFDEYVLPCLEDLFKSIGAKLIQFYGPQKTLNHRMEESICDQCLMLKIEWLEIRYRYPIAPNLLPERADNHREVHALYKKGILCDLSLIAADGVFSVHSLIIYTHGGPAMQLALTSKMKEGVEKAIVFSDFSADVLSAYIDFVYLGQEILEPDLFCARGVNVFELLRFAHMHDFKDLVDGCTNLISLFARSKDASHIRELALLYGNEHLQRLYEYFMPPAGMLRV